MKNAILFDFWETLFHDFRERETFELRKKMMREKLQGFGFTEFDLDQGFKQVSPRFTKVYHEEKRTPVVHERLTWVLEACGIKLSSEQMAELVFAFEELGLELDPHPTPYIVETLAALKTNYFLGIVSDTGYTPGRVLRRHLEKHGMLKFFDSLSFSDESGKAKPHSYPFELALKPLGVDPSGAMHCGDLIEHDVAGAKNLGITAVLYTGSHAPYDNGFEPDYTISDWRELPAIAEGVFANKQ